MLIGINLAYSLSGYKYNFPICYLDVGWY